MHIPDGLLDVPTSVAAAAVAGPAAVVATRQAGRRLAERQVPLAGLVAAYLVVAQLLVFPVGVGTGAHLLGAGLALALVGPWTAYACVAIVVLVQALVLADGGLTALGLNALNNGVAPLAAGWAVLGLTRPWWRRDRRRRAPLAGGMAAGVGLMAGAAAFCVEHAVGGSDVLAAEVVTAGFLGAHLVVAVLEGVLTALLLRVLCRTRPDLVLGWWPEPSGARSGARPGAEAVR